MDERYNPQDIEPKWQAVWEREGAYRATEDLGKHWQSIAAEYDPKPILMGETFVERLDELTARLARMDEDERRHVVGLHPDRAPTIELTKDPEPQARGALQVTYKVDVSTTAPAVRLS